MVRDYQICTKCIMDTTDPEIEFDDYGICNHCKIYDEKVKSELFYDKEGEQKLNQLINKIKKEGKNKKYDCIIGVSGGVDSTMVAYKTKELGLRPLAVHIDNGWNSELSVNNIEKIIKKLEIDLYTYVVDWEEFKDLQLAFLKSSVINAEIPSDHLIYAALFKIASKQKIRYIIWGSNIVTEAILPQSWGYNCLDSKFIRCIHKRFGKMRLRSYPLLSLLHLFYYIFIKRIRITCILNYIPYNKEKVLQFLKKNFGYQDYGLKHYESIYTRFFQGYILPTKNNIDKRRAHLSALICSGQIKRQEALEEIKKSPYPSKDKINQEKDYVIKKLGINKELFEKIMSQPIKSYKDFPNNDFIFKKKNIFVLIARKIARNEL